MDVMKNIIPFKKDVIFKTNISEVTSISLENNLSIKDDVIKNFPFFHSKTRIDYSLNPVD